MLQKLHKTNPNVIHMTPFDESLNLLLKRNGTGEKTTNIFTFSNYKPSLQTNSHTWVHEFTLDINVNMLGKSYNVHLGQREDK